MAKRTTVKRTRRTAAERAPAAPLSAFGMSDAVIEQSLETGENAGVLQDYFGPAHYDELRRLARQAAARSTRGADRVLILPGIMGSKLGYDRWPWPDIIWADPIDMALGRLSEIRMGASQAIRPQGAILLAYLSLKLRLRSAGFDADFHAYDWRRSLAELGTELAQNIGRSAVPTYVVAHSMGGLVARASFPRAPKNLARVIMLGTPNSGSYAPVQAFRGTYSLLRKIALLDQKHSLEELVDIFSGFAGLIEMMPSPAVAGGSSNLFEPASWPKSGRRPADSALRSALKVQSGLPTSATGVDIVMIAGVQQETAIDARLQGDQFVYTVGEGDGTVPLRLALLQGARTYYVAEEHGRLPGNNRIQHALPSLIATGVTTDLPDHPPAIQRSTREVAESDLPTPSPIAVSVPSLEDQRWLLGELVAPQELPVATLSAADRQASAAIPDAKREPFSETVIIGRGRERRLELNLVHGDITRVDASCYVVGLFKSVAPAGATLALDRAMGGRISDLIARRMFDADVGAVSVLPNGRRGMLAPNVAFAGLGAFDSFNADTLALVGENVVRTFVAAGLNDFAVVPIGGGSGQDGVSMIRNMLAGILRGLEDMDPEHRFRAITICELDSDRFNFISRAVRDLAQQKMFDAVELTISESHLEAPPPGRSAAPAATERVYLIAREAAEHSDDANTRPPLITSLLTSGDKAAILSGEQSRSPEDLEALLGQLRGFSGLSDAAAANFADQLSSTVLAETVRTALTRYKDRHLVVVHDAGASRVPWETLRIGDTYPALEGGLSHRYEAANLSVAKWLESRKQAEHLSVLLVANPTLDLAGAEAEGRRISDLLKALGTSVRSRELWGKEARKSELLRCFSSGEYDVVHYAGHAFFDPAQRSRSGLFCAEHEVLSGIDLAGVGNLPTLMFFNACEAARVRAAAPAEDEAPSRSEVVERGTGFAEALLRGGIANFIGTYWPVSDDAAAAFAGTFYPELLKGSSLNDALLMSRREVHKLSGSRKSQDWADYVFYGDPDFRLKDVPPAPASAGVANGQ